jgi:hypothetical protein
MGKPRHDSPRRTPALIVDSEPNGHPPRHLAPPSLHPAGPVRQMWYILREPRASRRFAELAGTSSDGIRLNPVQSGHDWRKTGASRVLADASQARSRWGRGRVGAAAITSPCRSTQEPETVQAECRALMDASVSAVARVALMPSRGLPARGDSHARRTSHTMPPIRARMIARAMIAAPITIHVTLDFDGPRAISSPRFRRTVKRHGPLVGRLT